MSPKWQAPTLSKANLYELENTNIIKIIIIITTDPIWKVYGGGT